MSLRRAGRTTLALLALTTLFLVAPSFAVAQAPDLQPFLDAGEFGPARAAADRLPAAQRDRWLGKIAQAQAFGGARQASLGSLADIGSDLVRTQTLGDISSGALGDRWGRGGAALADFDTLIDLVTTTIAPQTWDDVGGPGAIESFPTGVLVDTTGLLKRLPITEPRAGLADVRSRAEAPAGGKSDIRIASPLRKVSLNRLERQIQLDQSLGRDPSRAMRALAGIYKIKYVFVYPETGDIVIAGPAGDWRRNAEDRFVNVDTGRPVLQLDDLVVMLRKSKDKNPRFGCAITPTKERLAATQGFLKKSSATPLRPGAAARDRWLKELRDTLGRQEIDVFGIDGRTRVGQVLVEADYRMKLVGMGLEDGVLGVTSYLSSVKIGKDGAVPPMDVLRWWFTLNYDAIAATKSRDAFEIRGQGVKVLSENELLTEKGERVHTGKSEELNREFARSFTKHFDALATKYPIYAELRNVFDLALVSALIRSERLDEKVSWHMPHFSDAENFVVALGAAPKEVETVLNHRVVNRRRFVAGISGGVEVNTSRLVSKQSIQADDYGVMEADHSGSKPSALPRDSWWWD